MTQEEYDRIIATGERQFTGFWANVAYFSLSICFLVIPVALPCLHLFDYFQGNPSFFQPDELWFIFIPLIIATLIYCVQKRSLKFEVIETTLTRAQLVAIIQRVAVELEWKGDFITNDIYKAKPIVVFSQAVGAKK